MTDPAFFGYGSLVNRATHAYDDPTPATLSGWRRVWRHTTLREVAFLSVDPDPICEIDGLIARVPGSDWAALDAREAAYTRIDVTQTLAAPTPTAVYRVSDGHIAPPSAQGPILLSYLDTVAQGFLDLYGPTGLARFFDTTAGWGPVRDDRSDPVYPRATRLTVAERKLIDSHLSVTLDR